MSTPNDVNHMRKRLLDIVTGWHRPFEQAGVGRIDLSCWPHWMNYHGILEGTK